MYLFLNGHIEFIALWETMQIHHCSKVNLMKEKSAFNRKGCIKLLRSDFKNAVLKIKMYPSFHKKCFQH